MKDASRNPHRFRISKDRAAESVADWAAVLKEAERLVAELQEVERGEAGPEERSEEVALGERPGAGQAGAAASSRQSGLSLSGKAREWLS